MDWRVRYHPAVARDLESLGTAEARRVMKAIDARIHHGEPHKSGKPLGGDLSECRRIRAGGTRIIYQIDAHAREAIILAVGMRRREAVYRLARTRR